MTTPSGLSLTIPEGALRDAVRAVLRDELARVAHEDDWIDQGHSPLGRKLHCALWRSGVLPGRKLHRKVLVRRRDLDAYVEQYGATPANAEPDVSADNEAAVLARVGARRVSPG